MQAIPIIATIFRAAFDGEKPKLKANTLARYAAPLREAGLITRSAGNGPYQLTEKGRLAYNDVMSLDDQYRVLSREAQRVLDLPLATPA